MLRLGSHRGQAPPAGNGFILWARSRLNAAGTAVEADTVLCPDIHSLVVHVANVNDVDVGDRAIVEEPVTLPASAYEANTEISEAINDSAIKAYLRRPIAFMEQIRTVVPSPIGRCP